MAYVSPTWQNDGAPAINAERMQQLTDTVEGAQVLYGASAPTTATVGVVGQFYLQTTDDVLGNKPLYQCVAVSGSTYTWQIVSASSCEMLEYVETASVPGIIAQFQSVDPQFVAFFCETTIGGTPYVATGFAVAGFGGLMSYGQKTLSGTTQYISANKVEKIVSLYGLKTGNNFPAGTYHIIGIGKQ